MTEQQAYSTRTVYWLLAVGILSFAGAAWFIVTAESDAGAAKAHAFSYSAIGHRAVVESLREVGVPVVVSRADSAAKAGDSALLVVAEPRLRDWYANTIGADPAPESVLLVLPKWDGLKQNFRPHWLGVAGMIPGRFVESILRKAIPDARLLRATGPVRWDSGSLGVNPDIAYPQLIESAMLHPTIRSDQGILVGWVRYGNQRVWVLSDPDILSNYGLQNGDNAVLALRLVDALRPPDGGVVFDETIHGYWQPPNLWRSMFRLPFLIPVIVAFATILLVAWSAMVRFGSPLPAQPPLSTGKAMLIENTAGLVRFGGFGSEILRRYAEATLRDVARRLNAPRRLEGDELVRWVDRVGRKRGVKRSFRELSERIGSTRGNVRTDAYRQARLARRLYRWKREIVDGS